MAVLTWRNVDTPRGDGGIAGIATGAQLLANGSNGLADALGKFGSAQTTLADNAAAQAAARYQTADGLRQALSDGSLLSGLQGLGLDPSKVDAATIGTLQKGVDDRVTQGLHQQQTATSAAEALMHQQKAASGAFKLGVDQANQSALTAATPLMNEIQLRRSQGDEAGARALENDPTNRNLLRAVDPKTYGELDRGSLDGYGKTISNAQGNFNLATSQTDRDEDRQADTLAQQIISSGGDNQSGNDILDKAGANASVRAKVQSRVGAAKNGWNIVPSPIGSTTGNGVVGGGSAPSSGSSGLNGPAALEIMAGGKALPASVQTVGDMVDNTKSLAAGNNNSSATGMYQITGSTFKDFAPAALGADWRSANVRDPAVQDKVGQSIWNSVKNDPDAMRGRWVSISPTEATALKGADWNTAREIIARKESGASPASILSASFRPSAAAPSLAPSADAPATAAIAKATAADLPSLEDLRSDSSQSTVNNSMLQASSAQRVGQNIANTGVSAERYIAAQNDGSSAREVATRFTAKGGAFEGEDPNKIQDLIERIKQTSVQRNSENKAVAALNAATAGELLVNGDGVIKPGDVTGSWVHSLRPDRLSHGQKYDQTAVDNLVGAFNAGNITKATGVLTSNKQAQDNLTKAQQALDQVAQQITSVQDPKMQGRVSDDVKQRLADQYQRAKARRDAAQSKLNGPDQTQMNVQEAAAAQAQAAAVQARQDPVAAILNKYAMDSIHN